MYENVQWGSHNEYQALKSLATVELYRTISHYLQTGDASLLNTAGEQLSDIQSSAQKLQLPEFEKSINEKIAELQNRCFPARTANCLRTFFNSASTTSMGALGLAANKSESISWNSSQTLQRTLGMPSRLVSKTSS